MMGLSESTKGTPSQLRKDPSFVRDGEEEAAGNSQTSCVNKGLLPRHLILGPLASVMGPLLAWDDKYETARNGRDQTQPFEKPVKFKFDPLCGVYIKAYASQLIWKQQNTSSFTAPALAVPKIIYSIH